MSPTRLPIALALAAACTHQPAPGDAIPHADCSTDEVIALIGTDGYRSVSEAVNVSADGDTIEVCLGIFADSFSITHPLTLVGAGSGRSVLVAPAGEALVTIADVADVADVTLRGLTLHASASILEGANTQLTLDDVIVEGARGYGVDLTDSELSVTNGEFNANELGGIHLRGGSATVTGATFADNSGFGIGGLDAAEITVSNSTFKGTRYTGNGSTTDGFGVDGRQGAILTLDHNRFEDNIIGGVHVDGAAVALDGDTFFGNYSGLWLDSPRSVRAKDLVVEESALYGVVLLSGHDTLFENLQILTNPETSMKHRMDDPATAENEDYPGSYGIIAIDSDLVIHGGVISGNNDAGIALQPNLTTSVSLVASDLTLDNNTALGLQIYKGSAELTNVTVQNTHDNDEMCESADYFCNMGVFAIEADVHWNGGALTDSDTYGAYLLNSALQASDLTISRADDTAIVLDSSALTGTNLSFVDAGGNGIVHMSSALTLENSRFEGGSRPAERLNEDGSVFQNGNMANDILDYGGSSSKISIHNSTFSGGDQLIQDDSWGHPATAIELSGVTISGYYNRAISLTAASLLASDVHITDQRGSFLWCNGGSARFELSSLDGVGTYDTWSKLIAADGTVLSSTSTPGSNAAMQVESCPLTAEGLNVAHTTLAAIVGQNSALELDGANFTDIGGVSGGGSPTSGAIDLVYGGGIRASVLLNHVAFTDLENATAVRVRGDHVDGDGVEITDIAITSPAPTARAGAGIALSNLNDVRLSGLQIDGTPEHGVALEHVTATVDGTGFGAAGTITNTGLSGIYARDAILSMSHVDVVGAKGPAVQLTGGTVLLNGVSASSTADFGMVCADAPEATPDPIPLPQFDGCTDVTATGPLGAHSQCGACL